MAVRAADRMISAYLEGVEAWKVDHDEALSCLDLEEAIAFGNGVFDSLSSLGTLWHMQVAEGKIPFVPAREDEILAHYRSWLGASEHLLRAATRLEGQGDRMQDTDRLRDNCSKARAVLNPDNESFRAEMTSRAQQFTPSYGELREMLDGVKPAVWYDTVDDD
jgi:hypothetical protein